MVWLSARHEWVGTFSGLIPTGKSMTEISAVANALGVTVDGELVMACRLLDSGYAETYNQGFKAAQKASQKAH